MDEFILRERRKSSRTPKTRICSDFWRQFDRL
jgi:hypothetical protein